jgi:predicted solute-binding protein
MRSHIELYVNKYTYDLGAEGQKAVDEMLKAFKRNG